MLLAPEQTHRPARRVPSGSAVSGVSASSAVSAASRLWHRLLGSCLAAAMLLSTALGSAVLGSVPAAAAPEFASPARSAPVAAQPSQTAPVSESAPQAAVAPDGMTPLDATAEALAEAAAPAAPATPAAPAQIDAAALEQMVLDLVNEARLSRGLHPLTVDTQMSDVARAHAMDMLDSKTVSHAGSDGSTPLDRLRQGGVRFNWAGENIWTYRGRVAEQGPATMHAAMMNEPHEPGLWNHIANILLPTYHRIGIGIVIGPNGVQYLCESFAD